MPPLILASGSPYRRQILARLGLAFTVIPADIDESPQPGEAAEALARRLSLAKARHVAALHPDCVVIGADQVAECDGRLIGKPGDAATAQAQLSAASGRVVIFHSGLAVVHGEQAVLDCIATEVHMRSLAPDRIARYIERDKPFDCAGSMRSESLGSTLTRAIRSDDPSALIGLPLITLVAMLERFGIDAL